MRTAGGRADRETAADRAAGALGHGSAATVAARDIERHRVDRHERTRCLGPDPCAFAAGRPSGRTDVASGGARSRARYRVSGTTSYLVTYSGEGRSIEFGDGR